jgi:hypothetical protein
MTGMHGPDARPGCTARMHGPDVGLLVELDEPFADVGTCAGSTVRWDQQLGAADSRD